MTPPAESEPGIRLRAMIRGAVQGVGFRPFVFRLANELGLRGWVNNSAQGVCLELEGPRKKLDEFLTRLGSEKPPRSFIQNLETAWLDPCGYANFEIRESDSGGAKSALVLPDIAVCNECLGELFDPLNRRYLYPFINCTNCGPRFSIIEALPYDRPNTSMSRFKLCLQCQAEYDNPKDRRFHAQPNACPVCGPQLALWNEQGRVLIEPQENSASAQKQGMLETRVGAALRNVVEAIRAGQIVAMKGLGGFHLLAAASNDESVRKLRERKHREEKPFAVMFPTLESARAVCELTTTEERLLTSAEAPIVLLQRKASRAGLEISPRVAPGNPNLGAMLPYTPLHHLVLACLQEPVVATSGNLTDEPICIDEREALNRLKGIADLFLVHNRPIVRHVDDSVVRVVAGREMVLRRARGYAPLPITLKQRATNTDPKIDSVSQSESGSGLSSATAHSLLAVGAHLKSAVALAVGPQVFLSQHIGDLETTQAYDAFQHAIADLQKLYESPATQVVADAHPDYLSTRFALASGLPNTRVQHHIAHVLSCMAENELEPPVLGVSWDGTGYGLDGTVWGGEFFSISSGGYKRVGHFRQFRLAGGEQAVREPRRSALGVLFEHFGERAFARDLVPALGFSNVETAAIGKMLQRQVNSPLTSSVGRLFDAVASLIGVRQIVRFEGQAAMELEYLVTGNRDSDRYPLVLDEKPQSWVMDWGPLVESLLADVKAGVEPPRICARFHNALAHSVVEVAHRIGYQKVVLSGGCFQNRYLTERVIEELRSAKFRPYWHQRIPPNDGGICVGQVVAQRWGYV